MHASVPSFEEVGYERSNEIQLKASLECESLYIWYTVYRYPTNATAMHHSPLKNHEAHATINEIHRVLTESRTAPARPLHHPPIPPQL